MGNSHLARYLFLKHTEKVAKFFRVNDKYITGKEVNMAFVQVVHISGNH